MPVQCRTIMNVMERLAPVTLAEKWDNVGLQIGSPDGRIGKILIAVDLSGEVAREAVEKGADMIITHHPFIFDPLRTLREDRPDGRIAAMLIRNEIALYCAHTNLDTAPYGINHKLSEMLGLEDAQTLEDAQGLGYNKIVVFVPAGHEDRVRMAMAEAGAGWIGNYSHCTFQAAGTGTFMPRDGANPFAGKPGVLERAEEYRLETIVPEELTSRVVGAMMDNHPYEEVAYDIYSLRNQRKDHGLGRIGTLPARMTMKEFVYEVKRMLGLKHVKSTADLDRSVSRVALCGGSGGSLIQTAAEMGADVYLTGDLKYHDAHKAIGLGMALVDAGHYGTEKVAVEIIKSFIEKELKEMGEDIGVLVSEIDLEPFIVV